MLTRKLVNSRHSRRFGTEVRGVLGRRHRCWLISPEGFRELRRSVPLSRRACAEFLGCSVSTVRAWDRGRNRVPWSAVRLLRLLRLGELGGLHQGWDGWRVLGDRLISPEGYSFSASDMAWWSLTCRQAEGFRKAFDGWQRLSEVFRLALRPVEASGVAGGTPAGDALQPFPRSQEDGETSNLPDGPVPFPGGPLLPVERVGTRERTPAVDAPQARRAGGAFGLVPSTTSGTPEAEIQQRRGFQSAVARVAEGGAGHA